METSWLLWEIWLITTNYLSIQWFFTLIHVKMLFFKIRWCCSSTITLQNFAYDLILEPSFLSTRPYLALIQIFMVRLRLIFFICACDFLFPHLNHLSKSQVHLPTWSHNSSILASKNYTILDDKQPWWLELCSLDLQSALSSEIA